MRGFCLGPRTHPSDCKRKCQRRSCPPCDAARGLGCGLLIVPAFTGSTTVTAPVACSYDMEVAAAKYLHALPDGEAPLALHFNGMVYYPDEQGGLQMVLVPWSRSMLSHAGVGVARDGRALLPEHRLGGAARRDAGCAGARASRTGCRRTTPACADCSTRRAMPAAARATVDSLLFEGYALYPYTPGATKNATPTPFGIVYPPRYAATQTTRSTTSSCAACCGAPTDAPVTAEVRFLQASGEHQPRDAGGGGAGGRRPLRARWSARSPRPSTASTRPSTGEGGRDAAPPRPWPARCGARRRRLEFACSSRTHADRGAGSTAPRRLASTLLSTHPLVLVVAARRLLSPLERPCASVNTLPGARDAGRRRDPRRRDHAARPSRDRAREPSTTSSTGPRSRRRWCCTSRRCPTRSARRSSEQDPAVREMLARADATTPQELMDLHGRVPLRDPETGRRDSSAPRSRHRRAAAGAARPGRPDRRRGAAEVDGVRYRRGDKVVIRPTRTPTCTTSCSTAARRRSSASSSTTTAGASRRHDRRRPRTGADARERPLPVLLAAARWR